MTTPARKKLHNAWYGMLRRRYGGKHLTGRYIDPEWEASFEAFAAEVGDPPTPWCVLCLRDPDAGFYPGNVYWGRRRNVQQYVGHVHAVFFNGECVSLSEAARRLGITRGSLRQRFGQALANEAAGRKIQELRADRQLSLGTVARLTCLTISELSQIEAGDITAGKHRLALISDVLGVDVEHLRFDWKEMLRSDSSRFPLEMTHAMHPQVQRSPGYRCSQSVRYPKRGTQADLS